MTEWNYDMDAAPRGDMAKVERVIGKNTVEADVFTPVRIIAASVEGEVVTVTQWLPREARWEMFSKNHPPLCWKPWPRHPRSET